MLGRGSPGGRRGEGRSGGAMTRATELRELLRVGSMLGAALVALSPPAGAAAGCDSIGDPLRSLAEMGCDAVCGPDLESHLVRREGRLLADAPDRPKLCPAEGALGEGCLSLNLHHLVSVAGPESVLRQWSGELVEVTGFEREQWRGAFDGLEIRLLGRDPSPAFCPGYRGPLEPAPAERRGAEAWHNYYLGGLLPDDTWVELHAWDAIAGFFPRGSEEDAPEETVAFDVPPPFAGRDIVRFAAFSRRHFLYQLRDGSLYSWRDGDLRRVPEAGGDVVEDLVRGEDGNIYYALVRSEGVVEPAATSARRGLGSVGLWRSEGPRPLHTVWSGVRRLTPELELATVWESTSSRVARLSWVYGEGLLVGLEQVARERKLLVCEDGRQVDVGAGDSTCSDPGGEVPDARALGPPAELLQGGGVLASGVRWQPEPDPWPEIRGSLLWPIAAAAGVSPTLEPETRADDAIQVIFSTSWGDAALVRIEGLEGTEARLRAYWVAADELSRAESLKTSWERSLNSVETAAIPRALDRLAFWEAIGEGRSRMTCNGERVLREVEGAECFLTITSDGNEMLVEAKVGDRYHYADWGGGDWDDEVRQIGELVLSLAGIRQELWGLDRVLGSGPRRQMAEETADEQLDELGIGVDAEETAGSEPPPPN